MLPAQRAVATPYRWEAAALPVRPVLMHCPTCGAGCDPARNKTAGCLAYNQVSGSL